MAGVQVPDLELVTTRVETYSTLSETNKIFTCPLNKIHNLDPGSGPLSSAKEPCWDKVPHAEIRKAGRVEDS